jgi:hypothetical protein
MLVFATIIRFGETQSGFAFFQTEMIINGDSGSVHQDGNHHKNA